MRSVYNWRYGVVYVEVVYCRGRVPTLFLPGVLCLDVSGGYPTLCHVNRGV